ncbi:hypothetical protein D3C80_1573960 [compost metagenome]
MVHVPVGRGNGLGRRLWCRTVRQRSIRLEIERFAQCDVTFVAIAELGDIVVGIAEIAGQNVLDRRIDYGQVIQVECDLDVIHQTRICH